MRIPFPYKLTALIYRIYTWLEKTQWYSAKQIDDYQNKNLQNIIAHAYNNIAYYRRVFDERALKPKDIKCREDLKRLPILTKETIKKNYKDLIWRKAEKKAITTYTSGSTGIPLQLMLDNKTRLICDCLFWRFCNEAGYRFGSRIAMIRPHIFTKQISKKFRYYQKFNTLYLNPFFLSKSILKEYVDILKKFNPEFLNVDPSALSILVRYLKQNKQNSIHPKAIFTLAANLSFKTRSEAENFFKCKIFDWYGSSERIITAGECGTHNGYHVNFEQGILELIRHASSEYSGFVLTTLSNRIMPLIRYEINDEGELLDGLCSCGRKTPLLRHILGGTRNRIITPKGKIVYGYCFDVLLQKTHWIYSAQFIQEKRDLLCIKIVKDKRPTKRQLGTFLNFIEKSIDKSMKIRIDFVKDVQITKTGKRNLVISKIPIGF